MEERSRRVVARKGVMARGSSNRSDIGLRSERGPVLLAVMVAMGVVAIDATVLSTAVPSIVDELGGFELFPWLFSIYLLAQAVTTPLYSKFADMVGRKPIILLGLTIFLVASILCGFAWDMTSLILFRALQGLGAGAIGPMTITIVGDIYTLKERARVQGYVASVWAVAAVIGPTLGGLFAQFDLWRGIFFINIPLCVVAGWLLWRDFHETFERRRHKIDYAGAALMTVSFTALILGLLQGGHAWAWDSPISITIFVVGAVTLVALLIVESRAAEPVLPLWVFTRRILSSTSLVGVMVGVVTIGLTAFVPTYLVHALGVTPLVAGLALATLTIGWPIASSFAGRLYLRIGFRATAIIGAVLVVVGTSGLALLAGSPSVLLVAIVSFVIGAGLGFSAVTTLVAAQSSVGWDERGVVTGVQMFSRSIGQALGAAALGAVANAVILSMGGDETQPSVIIPASQAVFVGAAVVAVLLLIGTLLVPGRGHEVQRELPETGPAESAA
jgi:EmrB/QacA subfamily drug resistance transporter